MKASFVIAIIIAIFSVIYSVACSTFPSYDKIWLSIYISILVTLILFYIEKKSEEIIFSTKFEDDKLMDYYLTHLESKNGGNVIVNKQLESIRKILMEIQNGTISMTEKDYAQLVENRLAETAKSGSSYRVTHIVNSHETLDIWLNEATSNYDQMRSYVKNQLNFINKGGTIQRVFIFEKAFLDNNRNNCCKLVARHQEVFKLSKRTVTLCYPIDHTKLPDYDLAILNNSEVFRWNKNSVTKDKIFKYTDYITSNAIVKEKINELDNYVDNSMSIKDFFKHYA